MYNNVHFKYKPIHFISNYISGTAYGSCIIGASTIYGAAVVATLPVSIPMLLYSGKKSTE
jgi:hypothetical protein